jgi:hypothetical protein
VKAKTTIQSEWEEFRDATLRHMGPVQRMEVRRAFYAGAFAVLCMMYNLPEDEPNQDVAADKFNDWMRECQRFAKDVREGRS